MSFSPNSERGSNKGQFAGGLDDSSIGALSERGAALVHNEPSTSLIGSYSDDFSIVGMIFPIIGRQSGNYFTFGFLGGLVLHNSGLAGFIEQHVP
ncbi:13498_t:CDS:2 [Funneliformis caledonium]|uniref:13498_t:CDS:1 n=1 Tax=Funneliformis caledonium TaxID=1117310 RepID=A0A9N9BES9_9GLOM|nr:13498_t:CDS:2 [Funneliformis caledonium]